jgi:hypothetical protein
MGEATYEPGSKGSFVELVERAEAMMYERKRHRAVVRDTASSRDTGDDTTIDDSASGVMAVCVPRNDLR